MDSTLRAAEKLPLDVSKCDWLLFEATVLFLLAMESLFCVGIKVEKNPRQVLDHKNDASSKMISFHEPLYYYFLKWQKTDRCKN